MSDVTIFHNQNCSTSRFALDEISNSGVEAEVVKYLNSPLTKPELLDLIDKLEDPPQDLVRKDGYFKDQGLVADDYVTAEAVAELLVAHPRLMQRPVLVRGTKAIIGRPKDRVAAFIA